MMKEPPLDCSETIIVWSIHLGGKDPWWQCIIVRTIHLGGKDPWWQCRWHCRWHDCAARVAWLPSERWVGWMLLVGSIHGRNPQTLLSRQTVSPSNPSHVSRFQFFSSAIPSISIFLVSQSIPLFSSANPSHFSLFYFSRQPKSQSFAFSQFPIFPK